MDIHRKALSTYLTKNFYINEFVLPLGTEADYLFSNPKRDMAINHWDIRESVSTVLWSNFTVILQDV